MDSDKLSDELVLFLNRHFASVRQLEALLFLHAHRNESLTLKAVTNALYSDESSTEKWLEEFCIRGFLKKSTLPTLYQYHPRDSKIDDGVSLLAKEYKIRPVKVFSAIGGRPAQQMLSFMDAFKIKRGDRDDDS